MRFEPTLDVARMDAQAVEVYGPGGSARQADPVMYRSAGPAITIDPDEVRASLASKTVKIKVFGPKPAGERGSSRFAKVTGMFAFAAALSMSALSGLNQDASKQSAAERFSAERIAQIQALAQDVAPMNMEALRDTLLERVGMASAFADSAKNALVDGIEGIDQRARAAATGFSAEQAGDTVLPDLSAVVASPEVVGELSASQETSVGPQASNVPVSVESAAATDHAGAASDVSAALPDSGLSLIERDIKTIQSLCEGTTDRMDCARAVHDFDPYVSLVLAVEDLPKNPYFPGAGADSGTPNLPGGYSIKMRKAVYGPDRVKQDLTSAGFTLDQAKLLVAGKDRKKIRAMEVPQSSALALIRIVKDDYEVIARESVNTRRAPEAFERLNTAQRAALTYAAYNTGTVYPKAAAMALHLSLEQDKFAATAFGKSRTALKVAAAKIYGLIDGIRKEITPKYRVYTAEKGGVEMVDNHRMAGYVAGWMRGQGPQILADQDRFEYNDRIFVAQKLTPAKPKVMQAQAQPRVDPWFHPGAVGAPGPAAERAMPTQVVPPGESQDATDDRPRF